MRDWQSQAHVKHYCTYHVVFVPKYRRKSIYGTLRKEIGGILRELCCQQGVELIEGYAMRDHIHMLLMIPTLLSISLFYLLYSMTYFPAKQQYHEKYHAQKILQFARKKLPIEH